ncbi:MAG: hypothetical protein Q8P67_09755 [archaeon]|nr:hypothetical protein [archaeon]
MMLKEWAVDYFVNQGALVTPSVRLLLYTAFYVLCLVAPLSFSSGGPIGDSPLQGHRIFARTHRFFWVVRSPFLRAFLPLQHLRVLSWLVRACHLCFLCCIVGVGGVYARGLLAALVFFLNGSNYGVLKMGVSHNWYVPMWALAALIFSSFRSPWTVDTWLRTSLLPQYDPEPASLLLDSAFTAKFIQTLACLVLAAAGVAKLRHGGWRWLHPATLSFYVNDDTHLERLGFPRLRRSLKAALTRWPPMVAAAAACAVCFELSAATSLYFQHLRHLLVLLAWAFHGSIALLMIPNYLPQCVCYCALLGPLVSEDRWVHQDVLSWVDWSVITVSTLIFAGYIAAVIWEWEAFPWTSVPMFSRSRVGFSHSHILDATQLRQLAWEYPLRGGFSTGGEDQFLESGRWLRIVKSSAPSLSLMEDIGERFCATSHHFWLVATSALIRTVRSGDPSHIDELISALTKLMREESMLSNAEHLIFQLHLKSGWQILNHPVQT